MKKNIIKNGLFSVSLHGILLACCLAVPAQKLVPLFCAGDSALTLTSLSICQPGAVTPETSLIPPEQHADADNHAPKKIEPENEENDSDNLLIESRDMQADKLSAAYSQEKKKNTKHRVKREKTALFLNGDARTKGIAGGLATNSGIHPYYPLGARLRGEEGIVKVEARVGDNGCVLNCAVIKSSGFPALDDAAMDAVKRTRFVSAKALPIQKENKTVLTFRFDLIN